MAIMQNIQIMSVELTTEASEDDTFELYCLSVLSPINKSPNFSFAAELPAKRSPPVQAKTCKCKNSKCLKLYCECFATNSLCGPECGCKGCQNKPRKTNIRKKAVTKVLEKNPQAFFKSGSGCNCVKSQCQKKYCECYHSGVKCLDTCNCVGCKN